MVSDELTQSDLVFGKGNTPGMICVNGVVSERGSMKMCVCLRHAVHVNLDEIQPFSINRERISWWADGLTDNPGSLKVVAHVFL